MLNRPLVDLRGAAGRRDHHAVGERQARHRPLLRPRSRARARRLRSGGAVVPSRSRRGGAGARARSATGCAERIILYVGTIEPRKNLPTLIDAFARAGARGELAASTGVRRPVRLAVARHRRADRAARRSPTPSSSPATCRSTICRRSTASPRCSSTRRCTKGSGCRSSKRWPAARRSITGRTAALAEVGGGAVEQSTASNPTRSAGAGRARARAAIAGRSCRPPASRARGEFSWQRAARESLDIYRDSARRAAQRRRAAARRCRRRSRAVGRAIAASTCCSARPTSCASIRSSGRRASRTRRSARCMRRRACASAAIAWRCSTRCWPRPKTNGPPRSIAIARASR